MIGMKQRPSEERPFLKTASVTIYHADVLYIKAIENNSVDLIVTSPPYDVDIKYGNYKDNIPWDQYLKFTRKWLSKVLRLAKPDGRLCLNILLDKNKGGKQSVYADITTIAKEVGWKYKSTIVWNEQNMSRRTAWGSWMSASAPHVIAPVETIVVFYKDMWERSRGNKPDITDEELANWTSTVWSFSGEKKSKIGHPAPFPIEVPMRCIKLFSFSRDVVLDPFLGSGTTLIACLETNRIGIGVEIDKSYCDLALRRLKQHESF